MGGTRSIKHKHAAAHPPGVVPKRGAGRLQWTAEGWFGSVFGGTLWLLAGAFIAMKDDVLLGFVLLALVAAGVAFGIALWRRRAGLAPHAAAQLLVLGLCVMAALAFAAFVWRGRGSSLATGHGGPSPGWFLLVFPLVASVLWFQDRR